MTIKNRSEYDRARRREPDLMLDIIDKLLAGGSISDEEGNLLDKIKARRLRREAMQADRSNQ